jgi:hypothetical protein
MLDPLTALSVASSVIQIVDFGSRLFALTTRTLGADGNIESNIDLELIVDDLRAASKKLDRASQPQSPNFHAKTTLAQEKAAKRNGTSKPPQANIAIPIDQQTPDERIFALARRAYEISTRLLKVLEDIKSKGDGKCRTWNAVRQSVHTMMKRDEIDDYLRLLEPLRGELVLNLVNAMRCVHQTSCVVTINFTTCILHTYKQERAVEAKTDYLDRNEQSDMHLWLHDIVRTSKQAQIDNVDQLSQLKAEVMKLAEKLHRATDAIQPVELSARCEDVLRSILAKLRDVSAKGVDSVKCQEIISSLHFKEMPMRHIQISETYADTFAWILQKHPFRMWLEGSGDTFWINGKPGSGKSTMMKMLSGSKRTHELLKSWSRNKKLVVLNFFFWSSGYPMQRSQLGLLQSLCHQILRRFPE